MHTVISSIPRTEDHVFSAEDFQFNATDKLLFQSIVNGDHTESLYVMDMSPRNPLSFEVLTFSSKGWIWRPLPRPLFFGDPRYKPSSDDPCTAINGDTIFVSPSVSPEESNVGTYCFDTVTQEWGWAGEWVLPFLGKTEHVPEFGLWFGLSAHEPYHLCAISSLDPPTVEHVWPDLNPPECWSLLDLTLLSLGSGRFCIAKFFDVSDDISDTDDDDDAFVSVLILTGVEVVRSDDDQAGGFKMIRHKSRCVSSLDVACVL
jgi:hypothetical protein